MSNFVYISGATGGLGKAFAVGMSPACTLVLMPAVNMSMAKTMATQWTERQ